MDLVGYFFRTLVANYSVQTNSIGEKWIYIATKEEEEKEEPEWKNKRREWPEGADDGNQYKDSQTERQHKKEKGQQHNKVEKEMKKKRRLDGRAVCWNPQRFITLGLAI